MTAALLDCVGAQFTREAGKNLKFVISVADTICEYLHHFLIETFATCRRFAQGLMD
jgi:hypothetical protein